MAHIEPLGEDALEQMGQKLDQFVMDIDKVAQECIKEASPVMESIYRGALGSAVSGKVGQATATTEPKRNELGDYAVSRPVGYEIGTHSYGDTFAKWESKHSHRYGMIAALFNYGVGSHTISYSRKNKYGLMHFRTHGVDRHPGMKNSSGKGWQAQAAHAAEGPVSQVVISKYESKVKEYFGNFT